MPDTRGPCSCHLRNKIKEAASRPAVTPVSISYAQSHHSYRQKSDSKLTIKSPSAFKKKSWIQSFNLDFLCFLQKDWPSRRKQVLRRLAPLKHHFYFIYLNREEEMCSLFSIFTCKPKTLTLKQLSLCGVILVSDVGSLQKLDGFLLTLQADDVIGHMTYVDFGSSTLLYLHLWLQTQPAASSHTGAVNKDKLIKNI